MAHTSQRAASFAAWSPAPGEKKRKKKHFKLPFQAIATYHFCALPELWSFYSSLSGKWEAKGRRDQAKYTSQRLDALIGEAPPQILAAELSPNGARGAREEASRVERDDGCDGIHILLVVYVSFFHGQGCEFVQPPKKKSVTYSVVGYSPWNENMNSELFSSPSFLFLVVRNRTHTQWF